MGIFFLGEMSSYQAVLGELVRLGLQVAGCYERANLEPAARHTKAFEVSSPLQNTEDNAQCLITEKLHLDSCGPRS